MDGVCCVGNRRGTGTARCEEEEQVCHLINGTLWNNPIHAGIPCPPIPHPIDNYTLFPSCSSAPQPSILPPHPQFLSPSLSTLPTCYLCSAFSFPLDPIPIRYTSIYKHLINIISPSLYMSTVVSHSSSMPLVGLGDILVVGREGERLGVDGREGSDRSL